MSDRDARAGKRMVDLDAVLEALRDLDPTTRAWTSDGHDLTTHWSGRDIAEYILREFGSSATSEAKEPWEILRDAPSITALACECENSDRGSYTGRDGHVHCDQCDGRMGGPAREQER